MTDTEFVNHVNKQIASSGYRYVYRPDGTWQLWSGAFAAQLPTTIQEIRLAYQSLQ